MKLLTRDTMTESKMFELDGDAYLFARPLSETEKDKLRIESRRFKAGETRTEEAVERKYRALYLATSISSWNGIEDANGKPIECNRERIFELCDTAPETMEAFYAMVSREFMYVEKDSEKNSGNGRNALPTAE
jgi:hypothetical protein|uniref:Tail assembly chaperone n=1 Tax=Siphoviridae sp. ctwHj1 TaxID=2825727 RepID=A0A8S5U660_9CAUD|nr:MAG TPA: hypothetical protein [Siphoviridae sp. ctwHj1]